MKHIKSELYTRAADELEAQAIREAKESEDKSLAKLLETKDEQREDSRNDSKTDEKTS